VSFTAAAATTRRAMSSCTANVFEFGIVGFRPDMNARRGLGQFDIHAKTIGEYYPQAGSVPSKNAQKIHTL
jgi:hypothetical protein